MATHEYSCDLIQTTDGMVAINAVVPLEFALALLWTLETDCGA